LERYGILGGLATSGLVCPLLGITAPNAFREELIGVLRGSAGNSDAETRNGREVYIDADGAKFRLLDAVLQSGVRVFLQTPLIGVVKEGTSLRALAVGTQEGPSLVKAKVFVDATGDGTLAFLAGAPYKIGRDDGLCQPVSLEFCLANVDEDKAITCYGGSDPVLLPDGRSYSLFCREANQRGELPPNVSIVRLHPTARKGERNVNATQANGYNVLSPEGLTEAEYELRRQIPVIVSFLQKNVPGYEKCRVKSSASTLGVRETRRILGDYLLNDRDVEEGNHFADVVVHNAWFLIDIHNPAGSGQAEGTAKKPKPYDIPYRCLLPRGVENLLTAGRCISGTHRAHASYRVMGIAMATGQAAGTAAALSSKAGIIPGELDVEKLRKILEQQGAEFSAEPDEKE
jgi:hypothetical protein